MEWLALWCLTIPLSTTRRRISDDPDLVIQAVLDGVGIGTAMEHGLGDLIADWRLVQVLKEWCPSFPGISFTTPAVGTSLRL